jgi:hypothetical protein
MQKARNILLDVLQDWDSSSSIWFAEKEEPYHTVLQKKEKRTHGWIVEAKLTGWSRRLRECGGSPLPLAHLDS